jgi:GT2 family glycosyltransferase
MPIHLAASAKPVTASIVSHGQLALIMPLLDQLAAFSMATINKVVLTINIPETDLLGTRKFDFPLERIDNPKPKGFGANHNAAFHHCESDWFLVLNPDIRFDADVLAPLLAQATPDAGLLAPRIFELGKRLPEPHRALLTPLEILTRRRPDYRPPMQPTWVPGAFMLFRSNTYRQIGGFNSRYFMYGEDADICARMRLADWQLQVAENLRVCHNACRASHRNLKHLYWHLSSLARMWLDRSFWRYRNLNRPGPIRQKKNS